MPTLDWIGKKAVLNHHNEVPFRLLKKNKKLSIGEPGSGNLLVQGDNLEALKALLPYYAGKVKCIYIDPPYNTGKEYWVYNDAVNSPEMKDWIGKVVGDEDEDLSRHDKWLCMMYPRLNLLRNFLSPEGIIFISIGKHEVGNLKILADEVFGEKNFIEVFIWNTEGHTENQDQITGVHEYVLIYARNKDLCKFNNVIDPNVPKDSKIRRSFAENSITKNTPKNPASIIELPVNFPCRANTLELKKQDNFDAFKKTVDDLGYITRAITRDFAVKYPVRMEDLTVKDNKLVKSCRVFSGWSSANKLKSFIGNKCEPIEDEGTLLSFYLSENGVIYYHREDRISSYIQTVLRNMGTTEKNKYELESMGVHFDYPKPKELLAYLLSIVTSGDDIILDSFLGSGTTFHSIILLNSKDNGKRRFVGVEMDREIAQKATLKRSNCVINGYRAISGANKGKDILGLGGGLSYCELGPTLFNSTGQIREEVSFNELARHVYFSETGEPLPKTTRSKSPLLGIHKETGVYLLYNGILKDKKVNGGNVLTSKILANLPKHVGDKVIYGTACRLSEKRLRAEQITFKQTPYEIRIN